MARFGLPIVTIVFPSLFLPASADVKLVQKTVITGDLAKSGQQLDQLPREGEVLITYLKGKLVRTESGDRVTIFDGTRTLVLNSSKKTYQAIPSKQDEATNPLLAMVDIKTNVSIKPGGKTKLISGKQVRNYLLQMNLKVTMKSDDNLKNKRQDASESLAPDIPAIKNTTELWVAEFPGVEPTIHLFGQRFFSVPGFRDVSEKLSMIKGVGLETKMTQSIMGRTTTVMVQTVSLSEAPLSDSLFSVPQGWKQVPYEAPTKAFGIGQLR